MAKVLAAQTRTLEFNSHNPLKKLGTEACACNSSTQNEERDGLLGLKDKPVQPKPGAADPSGRHSLKNQSRYFLTNNARGWPLPSTHTHHVLISLTLPREAHRPRSILREQLFFPWCFIKETTGSFPSRERPRQTKTKETPAKGSRSDTFQTCV